MRIDEYDTLARLEGQHWWFRTLRRLLISHLLAQGLARDSVVLDAGCCTGGIVPYLRADFPAIRYVGLDIERKALRYATKHEPWALVQGTIGQLPFAPQCFDAVISLDSLIYASIPWQKSLADFAAVLKPNGLLILNLPAFSFLAGMHDRVAHVQRRFSRREALLALEASGFQVLSQTYWNFLLFIPILVWRWFSRHYKKGSTVEEASDLGRTPPQLNDLLAWLFTVEIWMSHRTRLPFGSSLFIVARRHE